jgi:hypothetical protein
MGTILLAGERCLAESRSGSMQRYEPFHIDIGGRRYNATWHIEGRDLHVSSAYGSGRAAIARAKPEIVAAKVLTELVSRR